MSCTKFLYNLSSAMHVITITNNTLLPPHIWINTQCKLLSVVVFSLLAVVLKPKLPPTVSTSSCQFLTSSISLDIVLSAGSDTQLLSIHYFQGIRVSLIHSICPAHLSHCSLMLSTMLGYLYSRSCHSLLIFLYCVMYLHLCQ